VPRRVEVGAVAGAEPVAPRLWLVHLDLPEIAPQVEPGHILLVRCADPEHPVFDPYLPRAYFAFAVDRHAGRLSLLVQRRGRGSAWLASRREGDRVLVHGPIGRRVAPARQTRHLLLLADDLVGVAGLALLAGEAAQRGLSVTLLENVPAAGEGLPARLLRADVEYRATSPDAGGLLGALPGLLTWADEIVVAAAPPLLDTMATLRRARLAPFTLHGSLPAQAIPLAEADSGAAGGDALPCGSGACGVCAIATRGGSRLFCREGPAFPLDDLRLLAGDDEPPDDA
jgi:dihydroorotate dehydrogenase electron transfer subunit